MLHLLASFDWKLSPLVVNLNQELTSKYFKLNCWRKTRVMHVLGRGRYTNGRAVKMLSCHSSGVKIIHDFHGCAACSFGCGG